MKKQLIFGFLLIFLIVSCKEKEKELNNGDIKETIVSDLKPKFLNGYQEVFANKNLADLLEITLHKKSTKDNFANSISHSFIFEIGDEDSWDEMIGYKLVLQLVPIENERVLLNDNSKKRNIKSEYFNYDIPEYLSRNNSNVIIGEDGKIYFKTNVHSRLNNLEQLNILLQEKGTYKYYGRKISIPEYKLY